MNSVSLAARPPAGLNPRAMRAAYNNDEAMALASGDPRFSVKTYDRPGVSRAGMQWNQAGIDAAQNLAAGISKAYGQNLENQAYNARVGLQGQVGQEQFAQALGGLQEQRSYNNAMADLQRQSALNGLLQGLFG